MRSLEIAGLFLDFELFVKQRESLEGNPSIYGRRQRGGNTCAWPLNFVMMRDSTRKVNSWTVVPEVGVSRSLTNA